MRIERYEFEGFGVVRLPAVLWLPDGAPKCVLQITHGMTEHMGRYARFGEDLCQYGIAVAGFDLRGHGENATDPTVASFGPGGWEASIADMRLFYENLQRKMPGLPHYMLGFSLGSFLLREYLSKYPDGIAGSIIAGTGHQPGWLLSIMMGVVNGQIKKAGFNNTTDQVRQLSFGTYNQKFKPNRTTADWLCADEAELDRYLGDPLVRKDISAGLFWELLGSMKRTGTAKAYETWDKDMPIMLIYGGDDPVGDAGKGVVRIYNQMKKAGLQRVELWGIPDARHDVFHEESSGTAELVRHEICDWLEE